MKQRSADSAQDVARREVSSLACPLHAATSFTPTASQPVSDFGGVGQQQADNFELAEPDVIADVHGEVRRGNNPLTDTGVLREGA
jgi:hypothetical protein